VSRVKRFGKKILKLNLRFYGIWLALILICVVLAIFTNTFFTASNLANVARQVSVNIILACGMTIVIIIGGIDLSVGALLAFSSFIMADIMKTTGLAFGLAAGLAAGVIMGMINGLLVARRKSMAFVITLGTMTIWRSITEIYSGGLPISGFSSHFESIASGYLLIPIPFLIAILTVILCKFLLEWTKFGKYAYAIGSNTTAAKNCGVNVNAIITAAYMIGGGLAALGGSVLTSRLGAAQAQGALGYEMDSITAVVIGGTSLSGGRGRITGTLAGALVMGVLRNGLNLLGVTDNWQQTVMGVVIIMAILWDKGDRHVALKGTGRPNYGGAEK
jgi:ribose/xylose/arabinose/galactoside ABC-type transport system permease subunit